MAGYCGKVLRVNLSTGEIKKEPLDLEVAKKFLGGRGLGSYILSKEIDPAVDPLSPENKIIFATGPLTGSSAPTSGRYMVVTKSPLTGTIASSNSGGFWGAELKFAGYDLIIVEGKAAKPSYIYINDDTVEIRDAQNYWGKLVSETTELLQKEVGDPKARVLTIGPAGERLSPIAAVMNEKYRAAGRSGVGAVMGSKNLKAIVVRGSGKIEPAEPEKTKELLSRLLKKIREDGVTGQGLPNYGTAVLVNIINENGILPTNNFQKSYFPTADAISGETLSEKYLVKKDPCYRCPIACGRYCKVDDEEGGGPEYETIWAFGADCGVDDLAAIIKANNLCNEYGLDTISAGATIACAMELYEKGHIKKEELDGPELKFGSAEAVIEWTRKMGAGEGFGAKLALGSYRLAESYGVPELSMSVKKQELPAYDPRGVQGHGLQYATSNRGGCHVRGYLISPEILGSPEKIDRFALEGKANWAKLFQDLTAVIDSLGLCLFTSFALNADDYRELFNYIVGENYTTEDILTAGERIWNLERVFNLKAGIDAKEDTLPKRLLEEPVPDGPSKGHKHRLAELLPEYYKVRGWDEKGVPTAEKLQALGL
ncbi:aldehyde ferredoxin oxidoreductase family protein [Carboxydothermus hydrogenoformans]|uniref:Aldehyde ferredoxin oxidoreductase, tungsten-containing n=1 Tax=Carboxydothermus hydrogenoformans (strain ATCC BAA-161 / DSM 6008 / Z-2901) TaxID=246194 RepID=Q3ADZ1_CARHZ|nr:aldehyde ferredoxin oxidoreductase family protein [Carboxydothermus hydrogenoformans]ABB14938.1 aldehyde ferredoxin oxidoreductase, tungsten-containing [Carboxydothermus hydrogenoformans Z-2901]